MSVHTPSRRLTHCSRRVFVVKTDHQDGRLGATKGRCHPITLFAKPVPLERVSVDRVPGRQAAKG